MIAKAIISAATFLTVAAQFPLESTLTFLAKDSDSYKFDFLDCIGDNCTRSVGFVKAFTPFFINLANSSEHHVVSVPNLTEVTFNTPYQFKNPLGCSVDYKVRADKFIAFETEGGIQCTTGEYAY